MLSLDPAKTGIPPESVLSVKETAACLGYDDHCRFVEDSRKIHGHITLATAASLRYLAAKS
ncbi:MAG TPA: hypothetical protein VKM93_00600 [Terriglobia bacterium]|nr:hypothetical protein [Terriglobia bacterium]